MRHRLTRAERAKGGRHSHGHHHHRQAHGHGHEHRRHGRKIGRRKTRIYRGPRNARGQFV